MSRAYRIRVRESLKRNLRAKDKVSTQMELLEILSADEMAALLAEELERRGFRRQGKNLVRKQDGVTVTVDTASATVTIEAETEEKVKLEGEKSGWGYNDAGPAEKQTREVIQKELAKDLDRQAKEREASLQSQVTAKLEAQLDDLRKELDQIANRVTADALKRKAAQLGQIKELTEDPESGSMTIVLEV
jgi:hypothetical protein